MHRTTTLRLNTDARSSAQTQRTHTSAHPRGGRTVSDGAEVIALIMIAVLLVLGVVVTSPRSAPAPSLTALKVTAGDSLWTLAATHPVDGLTTAQVSEILMKANHLEAPVVFPGQTILVPVECTGRRLAAR
jgi:LysM repeat protein